MHQVGVKNLSSKVLFWSRTWCNIARPEASKIPRRELLSQLKFLTTRRDLNSGRAVHAKLMQSQKELDNYVANAFINLYRKCGSMVDARQIFDNIGHPNVVHWNTLLLGYAENGEAQVALDLFVEMKGAGFVPQPITYMAVFKACTSLAVHGRGIAKEEFLKRGREIHSEIGCHLDTCLENTLIDMYSKCGSMLDARGMFDSIRKPDVVSWNILLHGYVENGQGYIALHMFRVMRAAGYKPDIVTYIAALKACASVAASKDESGKLDCLKQGKEIHNEFCSFLSPSRILQNTLIDMYSKCGSMNDAQNVFYNIQEPSVVSWNALLYGYAENGGGGVALCLFQKMKVAGFAPDAVTYIAALKACASLAVDGSSSGCLEQGRKIHSEIGDLMNRCLQNTLIDMYSKCERMDEACTVFNCIEDPDVVSWTTLLLGYAENEDGHSALHIFSRMKASGCVPNHVTYTAALKACTSLAATEKGDRLKLGKKIHLEIDCHLNHSLQNTIIDMYSKCGSMIDASTVFDSIEEPDVVSWNSLLLGYASNGEENHALNLFSKMKERGCKPNCVTYMVLFKACALTGALALGRKFHREMNTFTPRLLTCLVDFYAKCGSIVEAREVFELHQGSRNTSTWNALLAGYGKFGDHDSVFKLFRAMQDEGCRPDSITFVCLLMCCSHAGLVERAAECFEAMPGKYGVTPSVIHYSCMVDVLGRGNQLGNAIWMLRTMPCSPNVVIWTTLLGACHKWKNLEIGREAFRALIDVDKNNASAFILFADIYGSRGMWKERQTILEAKSCLRTACPLYEVAEILSGWCPTRELGPLSYYVKET